MWVNLQLDDRQPVTYFSISLGKWCSIFIPELFKRSERFGTSKINWTTNVSKRWFWYCLFSVWPRSCSLRGFLMFYLNCCLIVVLSGSCLALWPPCGKRQIVDLLFIALWLVCCLSWFVSLRKQAYSNTFRILPSKKWKFSDKKSDIFYVFAQNIDCWYSLEPPRRGGSNEYPQSLFWAKIRKLMHTPVNPSFTI